MKIKELEVNTERLDSQYFMSLLLLLHMTPSRSNSQAEVLLRKTFQQTTQNKTTRLESMRHEAKPRT